MKKIVPPEKSGQEKEADDYGQTEGNYISRCTNCQRLIDETYEEVYSIDGGDRLDINQ